jgi:hypothetical protein
MYCRSNKPWSTVPLPEEEFLQPGGMVPPISLALKLRLRALERSAQEGGRVPLRWLLLRSMFCRLLTPLQVAGMLPATQISVSYRV